MQWPGMKTAFIAAAFPRRSGCRSRCDRGGGAGPPPGNIRISQTERDETGPTSFRFYAPRTGKPTKSDDWIYR